MACICFLAQSYFTVASESTLLKIKCITKERRMDGFMYYISFSSPSKNGVYWMLWVGLHKIPESMWSLTSIKSVKGPIIKKLVETYTNNLNFWKLGDNFRDKQIHKVALCIVCSISHGRFFHVMPPLISIPAEDTLTSQFLNFTLKNRRVTFWKAAWCLMVNNYASQFNFTVCKSYS